MLIDSTDMKYTLKGSEEGDSEDSEDLEEGMDSELNQ